MKLLMKVFIIYFLIVIFNLAQPQKVVQTEGQLRKINDLLYTDNIVVKFKENVVVVEKGKRKVGIEKVKSKYIKLNQVINKLKKKYGSITFVKQVPNAEWGDTIRTNKFGAKIKVHDYSQLFSMYFESFVPLDSIIQNLSSLEIVKFAHQPITLVYDYEPDDDEYQLGNQWNLSAINAQQAWDITKGDPNLKVGIVDDGFKYSHIDLYGKITQGNRTVADHGTAVAGVIAANTNNNEGVASLGYNIKLWGYGGYDGIGDEEYAVNGIIEASSNTNIINLSWSTAKWIESTSEVLNECPDCPVASQWLYKKRPYNYSEISEAIEDAILVGDIVIVSAGNSSPNSGGYAEFCDPYFVPFTHYPASYDGVIAVSATELGTTEKFYVSFNYGSHVDFSAPGGDIVTTNLGGAYQSEDGTSLAAPHVSALIALIKSINSSISSSTIFNILKNTADKITAPTQHPYDGNGWSEALGHGRINAYKALKYTIENYGGTFNQDVILPAGDTWNINPGVTLTFNINSSLKVYGTLNVNGTSTEKVSFDFGTIDYPNGIRFNEGSSGTIEHAIIKNAYYGVNIYKSSPTVKNCEISDCSYGIVSYYNSPNIETNKIFDCSLNGIYLYQGSPTITDNFIHDITTGFGLKINGATNTYIRDNTIKDCMGGIHAYGNQTIKLHGYGQNKIEGYASNGYAVLVTGGTAHLGEYSSQGKNSFIRISPYKVIYNSTSNEILAEKNYWGLPIPTSSTQSDFFYGDVEWSFPYSSPPGGVGSTLGKEIIPEQTPDRVLFVEATELADLNDHKEASKKFKELVKDYPESRFAGLSVAWAMTSDIEEKEFKNQKSYLELLKKHKNKKVRDNSLLWLATLESKAGNKEAVTEIVNSTSINEVVGVELRLNWANDLLNMYDDENGAEAIFDELTSAGASEGALSTIDAIKTTALSLEGVELPEKFGKSNNNLVETVVNESKLNASYPNPFNPSTTISYQLQQKANVSLVVYNSIGQEVAVLVSQQKDQGIHNVDFNASNLPSGLYIYRLQVQTPDGKGNISEARKMILMK